jgi:ABC-type antimicrobial peptide transport system permease subunit
VADGTADPRDRRDGAVGGFSAQVAGLYVTLVMPPAAMLLWLAIMIVTATMASGYPARQASRRTVREALAYE